MNQLTLSQAAAMLMPSHLRLAPHTRRQHLAAMLMTRRKAYQVILLYESPSFFGCIHYEFFFFRFAMLILIYFSFSFTPSTASIAWSFEGVGVHN